MRSYKANVKGKTQRLSQSPSPMHKNYQENVGFQLRELSPFCSMRDNFFCYNPAFITASHLSFIETPIQRTPFKLYFDHMDEGFRQISGLINWEQKDENLSEEEQEQNSQSDEHPPSPTNQKPIQIQQVKQIPKEEEKKIQEIPEEKTQKASEKDEPKTKSIICNCKKTKCLKLYCDCFRENRVCSPECNCYGCHNLEKYDDERNNAMLTLIDRNPLAFIPKIDVQKQHSKGCNCKKSGCQKKYCECFQAGVKCGSNCKCMECKNGEEKSTKRKMKKSEEWIKGK